MTGMTDSWELNHNFGFQFPCLDKPALDVMSKSMPFLSVYWPMGFHKGTKSTSHTHLIPHKFVLPQFLSPSQLPL